LSVQFKKSEISSALFAKVPLFLILFLLVLGACQTENEETQNLRSFYFPLEDLENGLVYEYQSLIDSTSEYWFYKKFVSGDSIMLLGQNYDKHLQVRQFQSELISDSGVKLLELDLFDEGAVGSINTEVNITNADLFSFTRMDSTEKLIYHVDWEDATQDMGIEIIKNRFQDNVYQMDFEGKRISYLKMLVSELVSIRQDGHLDLEWYGEEWYAENIGLVFYSKETKEGEKFAYKLVKRTGIEAFLEAQDFK